MSFTIEAPSEMIAKAMMLDKVGYQVLELPDGRFVLADADDLDDYDEDPIPASTMQEAVDFVCTSIGWKLSEPQEFIGGSIGGGFHMEHQ